MQRFGIRKTDANLGDTPQVTPKLKIIAFCSEPRSKAEIANHCGFKDIKHFTARYLKPLLESGQLRMTAPDKPNSSKQKYIYGAAVTIKMTAGLSVGEGPAAFLCGNLR